jgi:uncharacterized integral membrane protein
MSGKHVMRIFKGACIIVPVALALVFAYQNAAVVQITFLFRAVSVRASLLVLITLCAGISIGLLLSLVNTLRKAHTTKRGQGRQMHQKSNLSKYRSEGTNSNDYKTLYGIRFKKLDTNLF